MKSDLGNKRIMGNNIQFYMDKAQIERKAFAKAIGVPYSSLTDWINGKTYPRIDKIEKMANYFHISKADLVESRSKPVETAAAVSIPVLGKVAAGIPLEAIENVEGREEIPAAMVRDGSEYFGLKIHGDSMSPRMKEGDVVIVRKQDDAESGDIVIALVNGNEATCKRLKKYSDRIALISFNPEYDPMVFTPEDVQRKPVRIIGKVVELRAKF